MGIGLILPPTHAQTFTGQEKLTESPISFQALVYPVPTRLATIRININNQSRGPVRIQISDQQGRVYYDEVEPRARYGGYVDLSLMPAGVYTVSLSKDATVYTQLFRIEPPTAGRIALLNDGPADHLPLDAEKLTVSH